MDMSRKRAGVEIAVTVGLLAGLAGCVSAPEVAPVVAPTVTTAEVAPVPGRWREKLPEELDYLQAVSCAGLTSAMAELGAESAMEWAVRYRRWAGEIAARDGFGLAFAEADVEAYRSDYIALSPGETPAGKLQALETLTNSGERICGAMAGERDVVVLAG
jgi:hypothetical protein